jgi:hypothetical protein
MTVLGWVVLGRLHIKLYAGGEMEKQGQKNKTYEKEEMVNQG